MNLTLSVDDQVVDNARLAARAMGKSLNQLVREYLEGLAGKGQLSAELDELRALGGRGNSDGSKLPRDELYAERIKHRHDA